VHAVALLGFRLSRLVSEGEGNGVQSKRVWEHALGMPPVVIEDVRENGDDQGSYRQGQRGRAPALGRE
jgi:hypothetical protein